MRSSASNVLRRPDAVARLRPAEVDLDTAAAAPIGFIGRELDGGRGGLLLGDQARRPIERPVCLLDRVLAERMLAPAT